MTTAARSSRSKVLGAAALLAGSVLVHAGNYGFNLVAVRTLTPAQYADVALAVTLLLIAGFITLGFQLATARTVAEQVADASASQSVASWLSGRAFRLGCLIGATTLALSPLLQSTFQTESVGPFVAIGVAMPWALLSGVRRGFVQGMQRFGKLALSFQAEMVARVAVGAGLMYAGFGVIGGVFGLTVSLVAAAVALPATSTKPVAPAAGLRRAVLRSIWPAIALLLGEAVITHGDTLIVKQAFDPTTAGEFAAIALLGRAIFFVTWPVSMLIFPMATRRAAAGEPTRPLLLAAVVVVAVVGGLATLGAAAAPAEVVSVLLGSQYAGVAHWLVPYAAATALFSVAATALSLGVAVGRDGAGFAAAAAGAAVVVALAAFHPTIDALLTVELVLMGGYAVGSVAWAWRITRRHQ